MRSIARPRENAPVATTYQMKLWQAQNEERNGADGEASDNDNYRSL